MKGIRKHRIGAGKRALALSVSAGALVVAAAHAIWPSVKIDSITVILIVVALLPWLGDVVESIEMPGGWRVEYRQLQEQVDEVRAQATGASQTAEAANAQATGASRTAEAALGAASTGGPERSTGNAVSLKTIEDLAADYNRIRAMPVDPQRTELMNRLFGTLIAVAPGMADFDVGAALKDNDAGMRLAAYAKLYAQPDGRFLHELVRTLVEREDKNFSQYWAIRTIGLIVQETGPAQVPREVKETLRHFLAELPEGSDRRFELSRLLAALDEEPASY